MMLSNPKSFYESKYYLRYMQLTWLGHDGFLIESDKIVYIDPYQISDTLPKADVILITHSHGDHFSEQDIAKIKTEKTIIITSFDIRMTGEHVALVTGDEFVNSIKGIFVRAVPAYNLNKRFHPMKNEWNGYILEIEGKKVYHAGDTDFIPEMKNIVCDIALLPVSGTYVMTADEAAQAAIAIKPKIAIPMHFGSVVGSVNDAEHFARKLENSGIRAIIPKKGIAITL